jgi:hypothetical protein
MIHKHHNGHFGINGIDIHPASDTDADLITVDVTGTPKLIWDESASSFRINAGYIIQPATDSVTAVQVLDADQGIPVLNVDTVNERVGIGDAAPTSTLHIVNVEDNANVTIFNLEGKRPTPTNNDTLYIYYRMYNDTPASFEYARTTITADDITTDEEEGSLLFEVARAGTLETVLKMSATTVVVNEPGADRDFRIEAVGQANALVIQGSDGNVGIGNATPASKLMVDGSSDEIQCIVQAHSTQTANIVEIQDSSANVHLSVSGGGDLLFVSDGSGLAFAEIYVQNNTTADTVAAATNSQVLRFAVNGVSNNMTPDHTNDHITVTKAGMYLCSISLAFSGDGSVDWSFSLYKNNGATEFPNVHTDRKLGAAGDIGSASMSGIVDLAVNDTIELWMQHAEGVNKDITIRDCTMSLVQIGGT